MQQQQREVHPVQRAPAPWAMSAESYMLFVKLSALPDGLYHALEEEAWGDEALGAFEGGLGAVVIVRYRDTPVGPYDELMLIPGNFSVPQATHTPLKLPKKALRIARIYVSQRTTTYNGRLNWNIPKHLARFTFSAPPTPAGSTPPRSLTVQVFPPDTQDGDGVRPFFACTLTPWTWVPALPVTTRWVPLSLLHVQPPLSEAAGHTRAVAAEVEAQTQTQMQTQQSPRVIDPYDISLKNEVAVAAGTDRWCAFDIGGQVRRARGCWVELLQHSEPEAYWPRGLTPWGFGGWMEDAVLEIGEPLEWKA